MITNQTNYEIAEDLDTVKIEVLQAALSSTHALGFISSILAGICGILIIFGDTLPTKLSALAGLLTAMLQHYYFWRGSLDNKLLPVLLKYGTVSFDQALSYLFPAKAKSLNTATFEERLQGIRKLFFRQCGLAIVQSVLTLLSLVMLLLSAPS